jgi:NADPH-dependent ferric siderophore reductase
MNNATFIYILASCALIVAFAYVDYVQSTPVTEAREEVVLAGDCTVTPPIMEEQEEVTVGDERVTPEPPAYISKLASHRPKTYAQLHNDLERIPDPPYPYELYVYDCSEMSAFMEYQLEAKGYDTTISCSTTLGHAWVTVHNIIDNNGVDIECIPPIHIKSVHHPIETSYENITEALNGLYPNEFDWWLEGRAAWEK